jgi:hypothetical protein
MDRADRVGRELSLELMKRDRADPPRIKKLQAELSALEKEAGKYIVKDEID